MPLKLMAASVFSFFMTSAVFAAGLTEILPAQELTGPTANAGELLHRGDYNHLVANKKKRLIKDLKNTLLQWDIARDELALGRLDAAKKGLEPLLTEPEYARDAACKTGLIHYLRGEYALAETFLSDFKKGEPEYLKNKVGLLYVYYQTNQYAKAKHLFTDDEETRLLTENERALLTLMKAFGEERPYQITWKSEKAVLPFISMNALPVVSVRVNGQPINVFIDTGADLFVLKSEAAEKLGLKPVTRYTGVYAGGKTAEVRHARLQTLTLGDVTLNSVPVDISDFPKEWVFTNEKTGEPISVDGILSTSVFQQFLTTLDYPERRLVLAPRGKDAAGERHQGERIPFILDGTHFMIVNGAVNGKEGMTFFLDSGLDDPEASILLQKGALDYAGMKLEEGSQLVPDEAHGGLGGGGFEVTKLNIGSVSLGNLTQLNTVGLFGVLPPEIYHTESGLILDGFISHQFLRRYQWTIDFDSMVMTFR